uniref:DDE-type integrase/transposase/recombinase n=1 Tax=Sphaerothrix gracilis TaxID=3151835 RepID=UPI0031FE3192
MPLLKELPSEVKQRSQVLQRLSGVSKREAKKQAAQELGLHESSIYRLKRQYKQQGIEGLKRRERSDKGDRRVSEEWQKFIVKTYRQGNRGSRQMSRSQVAKLVESRAAEVGESGYPSRRSVYRILAGEIAEREKKQKKRSLGWPGEQHQITTRAGSEIAIEYSNQVWQCDHTQADILVVDSHGEVLGRPNLTTVVDTYSRCIVGIHLGLEKPSAAVTCLALRHAILPKQYRHAYQPKQLWETYGVPEYLYTDGGSDFTSEHLEQVASRLGIVLELRRRPAEGGIVERPFGTLNSEFFSTLPGYTTRRVKPRLSQVKADACLT